MQVFREQMGFRTNGNLGVDFVTLAPKMGSHLFENVLYTIIAARAAKNYNIKYYVSVAEV